MSKTHRQGFFFLLGIFLLGACMRMPITSIPSIINEIAKTIGTNASNLGILTTLPLICFGLISIIVPLISQRLGNEITIAIALLILFIGSYLRIINIPTLFIGTIMVGMGITFINVLLPAIVTELAPNKIGMMTSIYTFSLALFSSIGAGFSAPLAKATNWQFAIQVLSFLILTTFILWLPNLRTAKINAKKTTNVEKINPWCNQSAWLIAIYFGLSSLVFYTLVAWLPTIAIESGISETHASLLAGLFQLVSIIPPFIVPTLAVKMTNRSPVIIISAATTILGVVALLFSINSISYFIVINALLGIATSTTFTLTMTLFGLKTKTTTQTAKLSGMVQAIGYLLAAIGPILTGTLKNITGSWYVSEIFIILVIIIFMMAGILAEKNKFIFNSNN
ncbi:transport protein [Paucilactobacillus oligofermentans DSM 15707 = LMG 22743]|uniref:Transport protein n=1 Tax=Paucilactobacillus oligofermentans DSM 15707 = LMG 22743 TaxID=1423778 RepID=A0A0R1RG04_9LACO|nr:MFS transporter [Paucilactobacillus oligofermentans]KRL55473.1 transport protein [Paucilactobacillus oligofermentans DSM 15707 = LMG 22743]CUS25542.1 Putative glycerol transporter [Paucilactobacillus oligofermentans DSM 15707 = LMG 22743]